MFCFDDTTRNCYVENNGVYFYKHKQSIWEGWGRRTINHTGVLAGGDQLDFFLLCDLLLFYNKKLNRVYNKTNIDFKIR